MTRMMSTLQALLWGGTVGYVAGLLSAKKPGSELRQELTESSQKFCNDCGDRINKIKAGASTQMRAITDESSTVKQNFRNAIGQLSEQAASIKGTMVDTAQKLGEQGKEMKNKIAEQTSVMKETVKEEMNKVKSSGTSESGSTGSMYSQQTFDVSPGSSPTTH